MSEKVSPQEALQALRSNLQSVMLSTLGVDGNPHIGYTPFICEGKNIIVFVSQLSLHTRDLLANGRVSAMLIDDEQASQQIFARTRVSYQCNAVVIPNDDEAYASTLDSMQARHGKMIALLRQLPDFVLFRLQPTSGQFVMGFGQAYQLTGDALDGFAHARSA